MKLLSPRDAQAYNGAAICGSRLRRHKIVEDNFRMLKQASFPVTAQEWFILGEVQELTSYTYKEDVLKSYSKATALDPTNSIYAAKLWKKLGQHASKQGWADFQENMSIQGKNHQRMLERAQRPSSQRLAMLQIDGLQDSERHFAAERDHLATLNGQLLDEQRLQSMETRYNAIRHVIELLFSHLALELASIDTFEPLRACTHRLAGNSS